MSKNVKALALLSGGMDSILAALIIKKQGVKTHGLAFKSLFFNAKSAKKIAKHAKISLITLDISKQHLSIVKNPKYGYGKQANPCIDCHLLMLKQAKKIMKKGKYDFIITGEVLGQRSFSQNKNSLSLIEKEAGLKGLILRPLSAQLLPPTIPEQKGWIKKDQLLNIQGKSRQVQLELAKKFKISGFSAPGASCILTDPAFSQRFFNLLKVYSNCRTNDIKLLRLGRHFWLKATRLNSPNRTRLNKQSGIPRKFGGPILYVVGRNHEENLRLKKIAQKGDIILEPQSFPGPTVLIRPYSKTSKSTLDLTISRAKKLLLKYSPHAPKNLLKKDFSLHSI